MAKIGRPELAERNRKLVELRQKGLSYRQISKAAGRNIKTVFDILKRHKDKLEKSLG